MKMNILITLPIMLGTALVLQADILQIDGGLPTDGIMGDFPNYLMSDNTMDIPDASKSDGLVTLTLRDESVFQWSNSGYPFNEGHEINFHPGGWDQAGGVLPSGSSNLTDSLQMGLYYTIRIDAQQSININSLTLDFHRHDSGSPRRYYILDDSDNNGYDVGDVVADSASLSGADPNTGLFDSSDSSNKSLTAVLGTSNVTSYTYRFYISNTPNLAGNTHWFGASVDYTVVPEPKAFSVLAGLFALLLIIRKRRLLSARTYTPVT